MDCLRCGATAPEGKRFCGDCGAPLPWRCAACGGANPIGSRFCGDCGVSGRATASAPAPAEPPAPQGPERRQLTVMFCDLVGSTALGARLDPEDLREVIAAYHRCVTAEVIRAGGFVARYMGDGVLVYFGYPKAHETDAEHAVRAGLAVVEAITRLATMAGPAGTLATRVGIATGLVVVGDLIGAGASREEAVVGDTPNLANRLQTLAEPNTVLIADSTQQLTAGLFEYRPLGAIAVRGYDAPIQAWQVLREAAIDSRFEALRAGGRIPLFGRDEELALLLRRWEQARERRRPRGAAERRGGHRQVAPERGAGRAIARRTASAAALVLRAALPGHRAASGHFELRAARRLRARRRPGAPSWRNSRRCWRTPRPPAEDVALDRRPAVVAGQRRGAARRTDAAAAQGTQLRRHPAPVRRPRPHPAAARRVRRPALGRSHHAGIARSARGGDRAYADAAGGDLASGPAAVLGRPAARLGGDAQPARAQPGRFAGGWRRRRPPAARLGARANHCPCRRRAAVRGGADQDGDGQRPHRHGPAAPRRNCGRPWWCRVRCTPR